MPQDLLSFGPVIPHYSIDASGGAAFTRLLRVLNNQGWRELAKTDSAVRRPDLLICVKSLTEPAVHPDAFSITAIVDVTDLGDDRCDLMLSSFDSNEALTAALEQWRPTAEIRDFERVAEAFGATAIGKVARGFVRELATAIAGLDRDDFTSAHRIAGLAGTLGFNRVSHAWLAIDEGNLADTAGARREARLAQVAVARWLDANPLDAAGAARA